MIRVEKYETVDLGVILDRPQNFAGNNFDYETGHPITAAEARVIRYAAETEMNTFGYVQDIRALRAGMSYDMVDDFVGIWLPEEAEHGHGLFRFLNHTPIIDATATDQPPELPLPDFDPFAMKRELKRYLITEGLRTARMTPFSNLINKVVTGSHMIIGGVNEISGGNAYSALKDKTSHPVLRQMLVAIKADEKKHEMFYLGYGVQLLRNEKLAKRLIALVLPRIFAPLGTGPGYHSEAEFGFVATELEGKRIGSLAEDVDDALNELLGVDTLTVLKDSVENAKSTYAAVAALPSAA